MVPRWKCEIFRSSPIILVDQYMLPIDSIDDDTSIYWAYLSSIVYYTSSPRSLLSNYFLTGAAADGLISAPNVNVPDPRAGCAPY